MYFYLEKNKYTATFDVVKIIEMGRRRKRRR
jgi:hypothetical protein